MQAVAQEARHPLAPEAPAEPRWFAADFNHFRTKGVRTMANEPITIHVHFPEPPKRDNAEIFAEFMAQLLAKAGVEITEGAN